MFLDVGDYVGDVFDGDGCEFVECEFGDGGDWVDD